MKVPNDTTVGGGVVTIITKTKVRKIYNDEFMTLENCRDKARETEPENEGTILVIDEDALSGVVYRYGNHGDYWERVGTMRGWA